MLVFAKQVIVTKIEQKINKSLEEKTSLETQIEGLKKELEERTNRRRKNADNFSSQIYNLERENERLQSECDQMEKEIHDSQTGNQENVSFLNKSLSISPGSARRSPGSHPTNYSRMNSSSSIGSRSGTQFRRTSSSSSVGSSCGMNTPQYLSPTFQASPPSYTNASSYNAQTEVDENSGQSWSCSQCTFLNHAAITRCEICDYQRQPGEC